MDGSRPTDRGAMMIASGAGRRRVCLLYDLASIWNRRSQLNARIWMALASPVYTTPRLLFCDSITAPIADVWSHYLALMKVTRLTWILWKRFPVPREGIDREAILTARFTPETTGNPFGRYR